MKTIDYPLQKRVKQMLLLIQDMGNAIEEGCAVPSDPEMCEIDMSEARKLMRRYEKFRAQLRSESTLKP